MASSPITSWKIDAEKVKTVILENIKLNERSQKKIKYHICSIFLGFPCGSAGKESACNAGDLGSIPGLGRSPGEGKGYPLQFSGLENSMDYIVHGIAKSQT